MSIVNTETLQADKLVAKDGKDETQVNIPSFNKLTPFCYGTFYLNNLYNAINVSSITVKSVYFQVNFINNAADNYYTLLALRNGNNTQDSHTVEFYDAGRAKNKTDFGLICKEKGKATVLVNEFSFAVLSKGT